MHEHRCLVAHGRFQRESVEDQRGAIQQHESDQADPERFPQRLPYHMRNPPEFAGPDLVCDHGIDRHHHAHHGHDHHRPDRRAQRYRRQVAGAGMAGHGDVGHAHAHGRELADQHGPGQLPKRSDFCSDGFKAGGCRIGQGRHSERKGGILLTIQQIDSPDSFIVFSSSLRSAA